MKRFDMTARKFSDLVDEMRQSGLSRTVARFRREEDGSLIIFGLYCFVIMLLLAGVAFDLMRFEEQRTTLQNTLDRAVLAAADLNQSLDPKDVVNDYFEKAGLTGFEINVVVDEDKMGNSWRTVQATTSTQMPTWFMNMLGVPVLGVPAAGTAEERIGQVEISLVLDVSGSMNSYQRLTKLKSAGKNFIDQMFDTVEAGKLSISIVPYATQVTLGEDLASYFRMTDEHDYSHCMDFVEDDFNEPSLQLASNSFLTGDFSLLSSSRIYQRTGHFDPWYNTATPGDSKTGDHPQVVAGNGLWVCSTWDSRKILPFSGDKTELKNKIDAFQADGNTSIDVGMKWGMALLDPSMKPVMAKMIADGDRPVGFGDRPYPMGNREAAKVIVVMTDGENTSQYYLKDDYDHGLSNVYKNSHDNNYSYYHPAYDKFFIRHRMIWRDTPWGGTTGWICNNWGSNCEYEQGTSIRLKYTELWNDMSIYRHSDWLIRPGLGDSWRNFWRREPWDYVRATSSRSYDDTKDKRMNTMCNTAKSSGVTVYAIGLEAPDRGMGVMKKCATTPGHFYPVSSDQLDAAFSSIAQSINKLRLTN